MIYSDVEDTFITQYVSEQEQQRRLNKAVQEEMIREDALLQSSMVVWKRNGQHLFCVQDKQVEAEYRLFEDTLK